MKMKNKIVRVMIDALCVADVIDALCVADGLG
jgi:hypothetical protein